MAIDPPDVESLLARARRARADVASVCKETLLTLAETRRLLTGIRAAAAITSTPVSYRIVADASSDDRERIDWEHRERVAAQLVASKATARALAHALNQPLAVIRGVTELIQTAPPGELYATDLAQILAATDRAAAIVRDLVRVARYTTRLAADGNPMLDLSTAIDPPVLLE
ncbi:MAG: histidine kinase dimerization/phospho-acceptor domain-containing protein [Roseiflexaceae bacterium]